MKGLPWRLGRPARCKEEDSGIWRGCNGGGVNLDLVLFLDRSCVGGRRLGRGRRTRVCSQGGVAREHGAGGGRDGRCRKSERRLNHRRRGSNQNGGATDQAERGSFLQVRRLRWPQFARRSAIPRENALHDRRNHAGSISGIFIVHMCSLFDSNARGIPVDLMGWRAGEPSGLEGVFPHWPQERVGGEESPVVPNSLALTLRAHWNKRRECRSISRIRRRR